MSPGRSRRFGKHRQADLTLGAPAPKPAAPGVLIALELGAATVGGTMLVLGHERAGYVILSLAGLAALVSAVDWLRERRVPSGRKLGGR